MSIILNDEIEKALKEVQDGREVSSPYLICTRDGEPYTEMGLASMFRRHVQDSSVRDYALYDHKAKGATDMHEDGVPLEIICELCGHSSVKVTEIYIKTHTRKPVEANGRVMEPSNTQSAPEGPKKKSRKKVLEKEA